MNFKKIMLAIWMVFSLGWVASSFYIFDIDKLGYAYRTYDRFAEKAARGRGADPLQWDYNLRGYKRAQAMVEEANKNLGLFILFGFGLPLILLAVGNAALHNIDTKARKKSGS